TPAPPTPAVLRARSAGADFSMAAVALWLVVGVVSAGGLAALTLFGERLVEERTMIERYRAGLVVANVVWIAGLVASTGGLARPYWALMAAPLLIAAVSMSRLRSFLIGCAATAATAIAVFAAGPVTDHEWGSLVLVL